MAERGEHSRTERAVDRLINFSDAVVAVAITVMVLPLIDIPGPVEGETVWMVLWNSSGQVTAFLFTFAVVSIMWLSHNRILNQIRAYDPYLFWVNSAWLATIVLLPWFSAMYGEADAKNGGVGLLYWGSLALISLLGTAIGRHIRHHPELATSEARAHVQDAGRSALRGPLFAASFLAIGVVSVFAPTLATYLPFGIIPLSIWLRPVHEQRPERA